MYQTNTVTAPTIRDDPPRGRESVMYTASGSVVPIATHRAILRARRTSFAQHSEQIPPTARPGTISPHFAQA